MNRVQIDRANLADISTISEIKKKVWLTTYPNLIAGIDKKDVLAKDFNQEERQRPRNIKSKNWRYWLAKKDGRVVGYLCAIKKKNNRGAIKLIHVLPECQGEGLGSALFRQALNWLSGRKVFLQVAKDNFAAIEFYKKFNFSLVGQGESIKIGNKKIETLKMMKDNT
ncbi:MAG: GNAT family N-acetyltransferase [Patescibacteria group bacterium]|jgi:ribosomal protein S18 acetylase RimI-like enzyme